MAIFKRDNLSLIAACLFYILLGPYFCWGLYRYSYFVPVLTGLLALIFIFNNDIRRNLFFFVFIVILVLFYSYQISASFLGVVALGLMVFLPFGKLDFSHRVFHHFINIYSVIIAISIIVWIGVLLGIVPQMGMIESSNSLKTDYYRVYPFVIVPNVWGYFRFCGPFDEPGVVGTMSSIFLYIIDFNKKDKRFYPLLISGLLSLSLFFYVSIFLYYLVRGFSHFELRKLLIFSALLFAFYGLTRNNDVMSEAIWNRIEWNSEKKTIAGDNRTDEALEELYRDKQFTRNYWFGDPQADTYQSYFEGSSSYKIVVFKAGMVFFGLYLLFFILLAGKYLNKKELLLFIVMIITVEYQRPWIFGTGYLFLFSYYARNSQISDEIKITGKLPLLTKFKKQ